MIPTREEIDAYPYFGDRSQTWLRAMRDEIDRLTAELALVTKERDTCRVALVDIGTQVGASVSDKCSTGFLHNVRYEVQLFLAKLRAELAALKPSEDREVKIKAWEKWALEDASDLYDDCFVLERHEIENAVALMRSAGDPDAKLRELRAKMVGHGYLDLDLPMRTIDEMLAHPAPVEQPAAAVPDDTRELVAQLADLFKVHLSCNGGVNRQRSDRAAEIAARLRRSK